LIIGYLHNLIFAKYPSLAGRLIYIVPVGLLLFWGWVGRLFAKLKYSLGYSVFAIHIFGLLSLFVSSWQYISLMLDDHQFLWFTAWSVMYFSPLTVFTARLAAMFEPEPNVYRTLAGMWIYIIGLALYVVVFLIGFTIGKIQRKIIGQK